MGSDLLLKIRGPGPAMNTPRIRYIRRRVHDPVAKFLKRRRDKDEEMETSAAESPPPGFQSICPPPPPPPPPPHLSDLGQVVCGTCRQLNSYPQGATRVRCSCCQTINVVLEAHQTGNVKCGGCTVLLMYLYGAPAVKCSVCHFVTEIGVHNERPPLSVQQGQLPPIDNPIH